MREDFEYGVECGYYLCMQCNTPWYPVEVGDTEHEDDPRGVHRCPYCGEKLGGLIHEK